MHDFNLFMVRFRQLHCKTNPKTSNFDYITEERNILKMFMKMCL